MEFFLKISEQLNKDTEIGQGRSYCLTAPSRHTFTNAQKCGQGITTRLDYRTFHKMRKSRLQMCKNEGTRSQTLFVCKLSKQKARINIHSPRSSGRSQTISEGVWRTEISHRRNQRYQQSSSERKRKVLRDNGYISSKNLLRNSGFKGILCCCRQHGRKCLERQTGGNNR